MEDFRAERMPSSLDQESFSDISLPLIAGDSPRGCYDNGEVLACGAEDIHTWLGGVACGVGEVYRDGSPGSYLSTFTPPDPLVPGQQGNRTWWNGMVTSNHVCSILKNIR